MYALLNAGLANQSEVFTCIWYHVTQPSGKYEEDDRKSIVALDLNGLYSIFTHRHGKLFNEDCRLVSSNHTGIKIWGI